MPAPPVILPDPPAPPEPLGLIAAGGRLPVLVAHGIRRAGHPVCCIGMAGQYPDELPALCDRFREVGAFRFGQWIRTLRRFGVRYAVMVGRVDKAQLLHRWAAIIRGLPDLRAIRAYLRYRWDRRSHIILAHIARELASDGILLIDSTTHIPEHMADAGPMTERRPSAAQQADIDFGWPILEEILRLDVGQAIAVRGLDVIAVEAIEGTDRMMERAGAMCAAGWTLLKAARVGHDRRSDVPVIGPDTITNLHKAGGRCIALAAGDVIIIDKPQTIALADRLGVSVVGVPGA